jgi:hypothetical protein
MPRTRKTRSSSRRKSSRLSLKAIAVLVLIAVVAIGIWAFLHPDEARSKWNEIRTGVQEKTQGVTETQTSLNT